MKRICIVGASGKLGQYMVRHALDRGYEVVGVCRERLVAQIVTSWAGGSIGNSELDQLIKLLDLHGVPVPQALAPVKTSQAATTAGRLAEQQRKAQGTEIGGFDASMAAQLLKDLKAKGKMSRVEETLVTGIASKLAAGGVVRQYEVRELIKVLDKCGVPVPEVLRPAEPAKPEKPEIIEYKGYRIVVGGPRGRTMIEYPAGDPAGKYAEWGGQPNLDAIRAFIDSDIKSKSAKPEIIEYRGFKIREENGHVFLLAPGKSEWSDKGAMTIKGDEGAKNLQQLKTMIDALLKPTEHRKLQIGDSLKATVNTPHYKVDEPFHLTYMEYGGVYDRYVLAGKAKNLAFKFEQLKRDFVYSNGEKIE